MQSLTNLIGMGLNNNEISDVKPLQSLTKLIALCLAKNKISDIQPLRSLTKLTNLSLSENPIAPKTCPLKRKSICILEPQAKP